MKPLVSICLPVYNTSLYLKQCLESLYNQTIADKCEFIIVNDCSTDNSLEVINKVTSRYNNLSIKIISHDYNKGVAGARNTALEAATGKYCLHLDSDDWCELNYAETLVNFAENENADIVTSFFDFTPPESYDYVKGLLSHDFPVTSWTRLIRRDLFIKNNIKWIEGINVGEDPIISCKLFYFAKKIVTTPVKLYHYRENIGFVTKLKKLKWLDQKQKEYSEMESFFKEQNCYDSYKNILDLRKAEVRFEYIKAAPVFSFRKYKECFAETKLQVLLDNRSDFNSKKTKLFINTIDRRKFIIANFLLLFYRIKN